MINFDNKIYTGKIKYFNGKFGFISFNDNGKDIFFHNSDINTPKPIEKNDEVTFNVKQSERKIGYYQAYNIILIKKAEKKKNYVDKYQYKVGKVIWYNRDKEYGFLSTIDEFDEYFIHESNLISVDYLSKDEIVLFIPSTSKNNKRFAKKCQEFEKGINNLSPKIQSDLLNNYLKLFKKISDSLYYNQIKIIAQSDKITEDIKATFLKSVFEKADTEYKYKILFEDCLIKIEQETPDSQIELLEKLFNSITYHRIYYSFSDYEKIKTIVQTDKLTENTKAIFLKLAFEKADVEYKYKILFEDCLINIEQETTDSQIELLKSFYNLNINNLPYGFDKNITLNKIKRAIRLVNFDFLDYVKDYDWFKTIKKFDIELYNDLFDKNYSKISKSDRLYLWLKNLNPYYNYLEFVQVSWQLTNDERKLLNKTIKEYAKSERLQKFIDQVPKAELIEETEGTKTYKCKWRNLYYKNGYVQIFYNKTKSSEDYIWEPAREEWNLLSQEYFNKRKVGDIIVKVNSINQIIEITGLDNIEAKIIIAEIRKHGTAEKRTTISSNQVLKIIHNVKARNQCIEFLSNQKADYNAIDVQELVSDNFGNIRRDISFLFPIPDDNGTVFLIWESAQYEKSKATHVFKCKEEELIYMEDKIKTYLEENIRTRSRLNSVNHEDRKIKRELQYVCRINHDNVEYKVWENRMKAVLPFLK